MSEMPASGLNFYVLHVAGTIESSVVPADNTISTAKIATSTLSLSAKIDCRLMLLVQTHLSRCWNCKSSVRSPTIGVAQDGMHKKDLY